MHPQPHCPACAAPLPEIERQQIITCDFCGTDCNADYQPIPQDPPRSPPFESDPIPADAVAEPWRWPLAVYMRELLRTKDHRTQWRLGSVGHPGLSGDQLLLWAPALADAIVRAERAGRGPLADQLTLLLRHGGSADSRPDRADWQSRNPPRDLQRLRAADFPARSRVEPRHAWVIRQIAERLLADLPASPIGLIVLCDAGPACFRRMLELAAAAEKTGDRARAADAHALLDAMLTAEPPDNHTFAVLFDMATHLLPHLAPDTQRLVLDDLADLADWRTSDPSKSSGRAWRGPAATLSLLLLYVDDLLHERPELGRRLLDRVVDLFHPHQRDDDSRMRWIVALRRIPSGEGRAACLDAYQRIFRDRAEDSEPDLLPEIIRFQRSRPWLHLPDPSPKPCLKAELPPSVRTAQPRDGQAPCPSCGRALTLQRDLLLTACEHCGQPSRIAREIRTIRRVLDADAPDLPAWTPQRLVSTMIETQDEPLRLAIARQLARVTSEGRRYVELAPCLVTYLLADNIPADVQSLLAAGIGSMLQHRDPAFLDSLFQAIRESAFDESGSAKLLMALEKAGPPAAPLLFDLCDRLTEDSGQWSDYTRRAARIAFNVLAAWPDREQRADFLLTRLQSARPALAEQISTFLGNTTFRDAPFDELQARIARFIDDHTDPAKVRWDLTTRRGDDLRLPHLSWTVEDIRSAEARTGLTWGKGGPLDMHTLTAAIPALPGSPVALPHIMSLLSIAQGRWQPPQSAEDLLGRLRLAGHVRHDSTRATILHSITDPPPATTPKQRAEALSMLRRLPASQHVRPWTDTMARLLTARPESQPDARKRGHASDQPARPHRKRG